MTIRILVVDDHELVRKGLASILDQAPELEVVGEAANGAAALRSVEESRPDVVLMDVVMRDMDGIETTRQILARQPDVRVVALSAYADPRYVRGMLRSGARGYLLKASAYDELLEAVQSVVSGESYLCTELAQAAGPGGAREHRHDESVYVRLGPREREVLRLIAEGLTSAAIARQLSLSPATVETHRRNLMRKLDLHGVADLTRYAIRQGLTTADA